MKPATSIEKVCRVLEAFRSRPEMGIRDIAGATGLLPSDAHRIMRSLECFGYISQDAETRKYRLGLEVLKLGHLVYQRIELREVARPFLRRLSESVRATANLAIFDPNDMEVVFVEQIDSPDEVQIRLRIGSRASPHATAVGKVLAAYLHRSTARRLLKKDGMPRKTRNTITDLARLEKEFETIRAEGFAADREEAVVGAFCIGAPVRDHTGRVVAAISISMMAARVALSEERRLIHLVKQAAARISEALGCETAVA